MKKFGSAVILCGGKSRRMGFDKSIIRIRGVLLVELIAQELKKVFDEIILVADDKEKFKETGLEVVEDIQKEYGPAAGILTGVMHSHSEYVFVTACDMPFINIDYIRYMISVAGSSNPDCIISQNGKWVEPLHGFYSRKMINTFEEGIRNNELKLFEIIEKNNVHLISESHVRKYSENLELFTNLNYVEDLDFLSKIYGGELGLDNSKK